MFFLKSKTILILGFFYVLYLALQIGNDKIIYSIPCLWKMLFGVSCPGCGLTRAFFNILRFDFYEAYQSNRLVVLIIPIFSHLIYSEFKNWFK